MKHYLRKNYFTIIVNLNNYNEIQVVFTYKLIIQHLSILLRETFIFKNLYDLMS